MAPVSAQRGGGYRRHIPAYNPQTEITVKGTIEEVQADAGKGTSTGTHLLLKTAGEAIDARVAPSWFLSEQEIEFVKGKEIQVTGSKVKISGKNALLAREVKEDGKVVTLRNTQGVPEWAGNRSR